MMIKSKHRIATGVLMVLAAGLAVAAGLPPRSEYTYGFALAVPGDSEYFSVAIPLEVYRSTADPKLRDTGVYNAHGKPVPRIFEHTELDDASIEKKAALTLLPFYGSEVDQPDQLRLLLHTDESGITLDMDVAEVEKMARGKGDKKTPTSYIVDFRNLEHSLDALEFEWSAVPDGFMGTVLLQDSVDLQYWRKVGSATLADLRHEEAVILQNRVKLNKKITGYLRIKWKDMPDGWRLSNVTGIYIEDGAPAEREWLTLEAVQSNAANNEFLFDIGGHPPVDRVNVILPNDNVVVRASVFYRAKSKDDWRQTANGIFYHLNRQGKVFETHPLTVAEARISEWKVVIDSGVTSGPVKLKLGWRPDSLVFLAQGPAPFELVTGRARDSVENFPQEKTLGDRTIFTVLRQGGSPGVAGLGFREQLSDPKGMDLTGITDWKKLLLWFGLAAAVLVVGRMTFSLLRDLRNR